MICRATSAALPTSVWTRMYACTMASSNGSRWPTVPWSATLPYCWSQPIARRPLPVKPDDGSPRADGLAELGEFGLIDAVAARFPASPHEIVGIGDDSAVLAAPDGNVVAAVDF